MSYASKHYGVPADIGRRITAYGKPGIIAEDHGNYIGVNLDEDEPGRIRSYHPVDGMTYGEMGTIRPVNKVEAEAKPENMPDKCPKCRSDRLDSQDWKCGSRHLGGAVNPISQSWRCTRIERDSLVEEITRMRQWERHVIGGGMIGAHRYWEQRWRDEAKIVDQYSHVCPFIGEAMDDGSISWTSSSGTVLDPRKQAELIRHLEHPATPKAN